MSQYPGRDIEKSAQSNCPSSPECLSEPQAVISFVYPDTPADDAGFEPGCMITAVDGHPIRDIIDWRWYTAEDEIVVSYIDLDGDSGDVELWREQGEPWGFEFEGLVFDGVRQCRNACTFCFMHQLPKGMRPSLTLRDDDYRLSFLVGTFVTLTNMKPEEEARIIEQHISPLRVSLQVSNAEARRRIIGKNAQHGIEVLDRLLNAGIEFHAQIVLVPGQNDGTLLEETLSWAYERPGIRGIGIVPLGYTKYQSRFSRSFDEPEQALEVLDTVRPFQERALAERGTAWVFAADEFYSNAYGCNVVDKIPDAAFYDDYAMFEDGIGIIRSTIDDWNDAVSNGSADVMVESLEKADAKAVLVAGCAQRGFLDALVARTSLKDRFEPLYIENAYFGGNVDVTGLLVGADIGDAVRNHNERTTTRTLYFVPRVIFNDDGVTLDDMMLHDMEKAAGVNLHVVSCSPLNYFEEIAAIAKQEKEPSGLSTE